MQRNITQEEYSPQNIAQLAGIMTFVGGILMAAISLFVLPANCSVVAGFSLLLSIFLLVGGIISFIVGTIKHRHES